jgi:UDP-3-O-[3-hydroxymyristoyl] glucosamine N-acyltransferase
VGEGARLGEDVQLYPRVVVRDGVQIGNRVIVHSGAVLGADGFGYAFDGHAHRKIPQVGGVRIEDDVEIGANTTVDRGALDDTVIGEGVKLDNQIQVAHNVRIGAHTAIAACTGIAGSARIGKHCRIGGASGIAGHITIADGVEISTYTLITKSIDRPGTYTGAYAFEPHRDWLRNAAQLRHLAELAQRVRELEKRAKQRKRSKP